MPLVRHEAAPALQHAQSQAVFLPSFPEHVDPRRERKGDRCCSARLAERDAGARQPLSHLGGEMRIRGARELPAAPVEIGIELLSLDAQIRVPAQLFEQVALRATGHQLCGPPADGDRPHGSQFPVGGERRIESAVLALIARQAQKGAGANPLVIVLIGPRQRFEIRDGAFKIAVSELEDLARGEWLRPWAG